MKLEKMKYVEPQIEIIQLETEDIITESVPKEPGIELPVDTW